jgi:hypothetical protein
LSFLQASLRSVLDRRLIWASIAVMLALTLLVAVTAPPERTLGGDNARLVYFHGALAGRWPWPWRRAGLVALQRRSGWLHAASKAQSGWRSYGGRSTNPVSILAANATWANNSWNLTFLMEPRFLMAFQMMALMLIAQAVLLFSNHPMAPGLVNVAVVAIMILLLHVTERVLHPPAPIRDAESLRIQLAFGVMTVLLLAAGGQLARWLYHKDAGRQPADSCAGLIHRPRSWGRFLQKAARCPTTTPSIAATRSWPCA